MKLSNILISTCVAGVCSGAVVVLEERAACDAVDLVYSLLKGPLKATAGSLCSSYLGYPRSTSITVTGPASTVTQTSTLPPSTVTTSVTETNIVSNTATAVVTDPQPTVTKTIEVFGYPTTIYTKRSIVEKRALPSALATFAANKISSACSCIVTATTKTATVTASNTQTNTVTAIVPASNTVTVTNTIFVSSTIINTVTIHVTQPATTTTITVTYIPTIYLPRTA